MHNNYYFLRHLSAALNTRLQGFSVVSCFSQNKEELIIELNDKKSSFFIKAHLLSSFSCLSFPGQFNRAKKNSVDLFGELILKRFTGVTQYENERSFALHFEKGYALIFKMHANRSNILLALDGQVIQIFRNQFKSDLDLSPAQLNRTIDWTEDAFHSNLHRLNEVYPTFGREVWSYLDENGFETLTGPAKWNLLQKTLRLLTDPTIYLNEQNNKIKLSLLPSHEILRQFTDPIAAVNEFFYIHTTTEALHKDKSFLDKKFKATIEACEGYIAKNEIKLAEIKDDKQYKIWADVLMANLHQVGKGLKKISLSDFNSQPTTIKLNPELSAQKNAEAFYRKAKNQEIEIRKINEAINQKKQELADARSQLKLLNEITTIDELKQHFKKIEGKSAKKEDPFPFHEVEFKGYKIWIGKNAANNDLLTLKYTHKDDLWLHVKDVSGSHVVVKHHSGKPIPKEVVERAAELAAFNSKRKTESLCPVAFTQKKFVRKRKGDPAGAVVVEREQVIMVEPKL